MQRSLFNQIIQSQGSHKFLFISYFYECCTMKCWNAKQSSAFVTFLGTLLLLNSCKVKMKHNLTEHALMWQFQNRTQKQTRRWKITYCRIYFTLNWGETVSSLIVQVNGVFLVKVRGGWVSWVESPHGAMESDGWVPDWEFSQGSVNGSSTHDFQARGLLYGTKR